MNPGLIFWVSVNGKNEAMNERGFSVTVILTL